MTKFDYIDSKQNTPDNIDWDGVLWTKRNDVYKNITKDIKLYAVVEFEPIDLFSPSLHSSKKPFTPETRYDAQYCCVDNIFN